MTDWYILPNGNIKHINGLELRPDKDWFPTEESLAAFVSPRAEAGLEEAEIIKEMLELANACERWVQENLG